MGQEKDIVSVIVPEQNVVVVLPEESVVAFTHDETDVVVVPEVGHVSSEETQIYAVSVGQQGPRGPVGPTGPAGSTTISVLAGETLSDKRVVTTDSMGRAILVDANNSTHIHTALGIVRGATMSGDPAAIQVMGEVEEPTWNWVVGQPLYVTGMGQLTQTVPVSGYILQVATPISSTRVAISIKMPLVLL